MNYWTPQNYCSKVTVNLIIHLEDPVSTKTNHRDLHKDNIHERAETAQTLRTDTNATMSPWKNVYSHCHVEKVTNNTENEDWPTISEKNWIYQKALF